MQDFLLSSDLLLIETLIHLLFDFLIMSFSGGGGIQWVYRSVPFGNIQRAKFYYLNNIVFKKCILEGYTSNCAMEFILFSVCNFRSVMLLSSFWLSGKFQNELETLWGLEILFLHILTLKNLSLDSLVSSHNANSVCNMMSLYQKYDVEIKNSR